MRIPLKSRLMIDEGAEWPRYWGWPWGLAWRDHQTLHAVVLPVPLNLVVGAARWIYFRILAGIKPGKLERAESLVEYYLNNSQNYQRRWRNSRSRVDELQRSERRAIRISIAMAKECQRLTGLLKIAGIDPEPPEQEDVSCPP